MANSSYAQSLNGIIIGSVVGAGALITIAITSIWLYRRNKRVKREREEDRRFKLYGFQLDENGQIQPPRQAPRRSAGVNADGDRAGEGIGSAVQEDRKLGRMDESCHAFPGCVDPANTTPHRADRGLSTMPHSNFTIESSPQSRIASEPFPIHRTPSVALAQPGPIVPPAATDAMAQTEDDRGFERKLRILNHHGFLAEPERDPASNSAGASGPQREQQRQEERAEDAGRVGEGMLPPSYNPAWREQ